MSLVEKAIEKMRANDLLRRETPPQPTPVIAKVVNAPAPAHALLRRNNKPELPPFNPKRQAEFDHAMQTAKQLIGIYLQPLRRKPSWL